MDTVPTRADVDALWRSLIAGRVTREEVHERVAPWVEGRWREVRDIAVESGLQSLHGFDLTWDEGAPGVVRHGPGDFYFHSDEEVVDSFRRWQDFCRHRDGF